MSFKRLTIIVLIACMHVLWANAAKLNMFIESNKFLTEPSGDTILHIDYQIPYQNLIFTAKNGAFFAELDIRLTVIKADSLIYDKVFEDNIGIRNKHDITSTGKSYQNRLSLVLGEGEHQINFSAKDINGNTEFKWHSIIKPLSTGSMLSDIELCSVVRPDTTQFLSRFKRGNTLYKTEPSMIFPKDLLEDMFLYYEIYTPGERLGRVHQALLMLEKGDELVFDRLFEYIPTYAKEGKSLKIPLQNLDPGLYFGSLTTYIDTLKQSRTFEFLVTEKTEQLYFLFADTEDEFRLMKYFLASRTPSNWQAMDKESKRRYISQFWQVLAGGNNMKIDDMMLTMQERLQFVNKYYSHFEPGWTTDMGRIYMRNGAPDDIDKEQTSDDTRFVRKDYQIWRYSQRRNALYVFIDIQMNGNYRLIYVANDDMEFSNPDWQKYLGTEFDTTKLRN